MILLMKSIKFVLGQNIKVHRKRIGLTQGGLAARVGISKSTVTLIETGKVWPEYENIEAISKVLSVDQRTLFIDADGRLAALKPTPTEALAVISKLIEDLDTDKS